MAESPFYTANQYRHYPFADAEDFPQSAIVDFGCLIGLSGQFNAATDTVQLTAVTRTTLTTLTFTVTVSSPAVTASQLFFTRNLNETEFTFEFTGTADFGGQLVTGDLTPLTVLLPAVGDTLSPNLEFLPSLIQDLGQSFVRQVKLWNADRTRVTAAPGCPPLVWPFTLQNQYQVTSVGSGSLLFREGHNSTIKLSTTDNSIGFSAGSGRGLGAQCAEIPVFTGETPPTGSVFLSGGIRCKDTISSINGLNAKNITITSGAGIQLLSAPAANRIEVKVEATSLEGCEL